MSAQAQTVLPWFRLDNAAKVFPVLAHARHVTTFRLAAVLHERVEPQTLRQAVALVLPRFPHLAVRLRRGAFWYYLEHYAGDPPVELDVREPLRPWTRREKRRFLFRVRYWEKRIAVEFHHSLTDGAGGLIFLKTLLAAYQTLLGHPVAPAGDVLDWTEPASPEELEDAYSRYSSFRFCRRPKLSRAFHLTGTLSPGHMLHVISGTMSAKQVAALAGSMHVSVTEFLAALYLFELYQVQQKGGYRVNDAVRVSLPINVRRFFPTATLRNFALYATPGIEPALGEYDFAEILGLVHHFMRFTVNAKYLNAMMGANVRPERLFLMRIAPLPLKSLVLRIAYWLEGESRFTSSLSNLGLTRLPEGLAEAVEHLEFMLGPSRTNTVNCGVISTGDRLVVSFTATIPETDVQRRFFRHLVRLGIAVKVFSNRRTEEEEGVS